MKAAIISSDSGSASIMNWSIEFYPLKFLLKSRYILSSESNCSNNLSKYVSDFWSCNIRPKSDVP